MRWLANALRQTPEASGGDAAGGDAEDPRSDDPGRLLAVLERGSRFLDGALDVAVASFAVWTLIYWMMLLGVPLAPGAGIWALATLGLVALRGRRPWFERRVARGWLGTAAAMVAAVAAAVLASVISRVDADDAWYVVRSTWVADHGDIAARDIPSRTGIGLRRYSPIPTSARSRYSSAPSRDTPACPRGTSPTGTSCLWRRSQPSGPCGDSSSRGVRGDRRRRSCCP